MQQTIHPLQKIIHNSLGFVGAFIAFCLNVLIILSAILLVNSAGYLGQVTQIVALIFVIIACAIVGYIYFLNRSQGIVIINSNKSSRLDNFLPTQIFIVFFGFVQTIFWVAQPENPIHEPRSVFIIAVAGALAYFRSQYLRSSSPD